MGISRRDLFKNAFVGGAATLLTRGSAAEEDFEEEIFNLPTEEPRKSTVEGNRLILGDDIEYENRFETDVRVEHVLGRHEIASTSVGVLTATTTIRVWTDCPVVRHFLNDAVQTGHEVELEYPERFLLKRARATELSETLVYGQLRDIRVTFFGIEYEDHHDGV